MSRFKRRTFAGAVLEQEVYTVSDNVREPEQADKRIRFHTEEERAEHRLHISRTRHARLFNENFSPTSFYSTLTFDMENECHDIWEAKKLRDLYFRRLRYAFPLAVIFIYIGRGKHTNRFHLHMVSDGIPKEAIAEKWKYGHVKRVDRLRANNFYDGKDYGQDYTGLANYLFDHWTPEIGGHRWKQTRNAKAPLREKMVEVVREYSIIRPPMAPPGYRLVEARGTRYGYLYFKYVREEENKQDAACKTKNGKHRMRN